MASLPSVESVTVLRVIVGVSVASAVLGWIEDVRGVSIRVRAGAQICIGLIASSIVVGHAGVAPWLVVVFTIGVAGYINVANFMDGVNGISALHGTVVGVTYAILGVVFELPWLAITGGIVALAFFGFLPWNLRGRIFLGDVGSYLLGGSISITAVAALAHGVPFLAVIAPLIVYLADAGFTLVSRVIRGRRWSDAHRDHVYQRLTDSGISHFRVALLVTGLSLCAGAIGIWAAVKHLPWPIEIVLLSAILAAYFVWGAVATCLKRTSTEMIDREGMNS
ncbi:UDP-phosphate glycosyltransferase [Cryobacterium lyxosi]|uniref:UDP-phosphate glycosyltransferase n=1 Tax=Cryobacterium lyxosi TaxID=1259228 RepID=UPI00141ABF8F|nr:UDP-phosphate glycosyltransferase [Cryobacterium lyxosi]